MKNKRKTKLIRIDHVWHKILKVKAAERDTTISKLIDEACINYFGEKVYDKFNKKLNKKSYL